MDLENILKLADFNMPTTAYPGEVMLQETRLLVEARYNWPAKQYHKFLNTYTEKYGLASAEARHNVAEMQAIMGDVSDISVQYLPPGQ